MPSRHSLSRWIESRPLQVLALLLLLALVVDAGWLWSHPPSVDSGETSHWWPIVVNVAQGRGYSGCFPEYFPFCGPANQVTAAREPVPVLLFAAVERLTTESLLPAVVLEIALNLGILIGIFLLAQRLAGPRAATVAALLWSLYVPALEMILQVSGDLAATLCLVWGMFFLVRARRTDQARDWLAAGGWVAVGTLSRSAVMVLAPALGLVEFLRTPVATRARWRGVALSGSIFLLTMCPWILRNYAVFGHPVLGSTLMGYNLYRQNYLLSSPDYRRIVAGEEGERAVQELLARRPDLRGTENEAEMNAVYVREALRTIKAWPLRYLHLSAYRFLPLWFNWGVLEAYGVRSRLRDYLLGGEQAILLALAIGGLGYLGREGWSLAAGAAAYSVAHMLVNSQLRYIVPVMPLVMVLSAVTLQRALRCLPEPGNAEKTAIHDRVDEGALR